MSNRLAQVFFDQSTKEVDKWEHYLAIYERAMAPYLTRGRPIELLEIGVQNGGSLELWHKYLPPGSRIVGIDVDPSVASLSFDTNAIEVYVADATDNDSLDQILGSRNFDIIIDDGSHFAKDIIITFDALFRRVSAGGLYIVEDLHCSYYPSHQGGFKKPDSPIEWFKNFADAVNYDYITESDVTHENYMQLNLYNKTIASTCFYDSVVVIEKLLIEKTEPYRRIYSGCEGVIEPSEKWISTLSNAALENILVGHVSARGIDRKLLKILEEQKLIIESMRNSDDERKLQINEFKEKSDILEKKLLQIAVNHKDTIAEMQESHSKLVDKVRRDHYSEIDEIRMSVVKAKRLFEENGEKRR